MISWSCGTESDPRCGERVGRTSWRSMPFKALGARARALSSVALWVALGACETATPPQPAGTLAFGATCGSDAECASGACHLTDGGVSFCTRACEQRGDETDDCHEYGVNWTCLHDGSPDPECVCVWDSPVERCADGMDNDCNGVADDGCSECAPACARGASCLEGACVCPAGHDVCDGACVTLPGDRDNCGTCGNVCPDDGWCMEGACVCAMPGAVVCGSDCALLASSTAHCGACGNACPEGATCRDGTCECPAGQIACEGRCVDLSSDPLACGECGNACLIGGTCDAGVCGCDPERAVCSDECADLGSSELNCGACGTACEHLCLDAACDVPVQVEGMWRHACARTASGRVACWGSNEQGQVGADSDGTPYVVPLPLPATSIATGTDFTCALLSDRSVWCWGSNTAAQLGREVWESAERVPPGPVADIHDAIAVAAGGGGACVIHEGGAVSCWGSSWAGELGPTLEPVTRPRTMPVTNAVEITGGYRHWCARLDDGTATCWGTNDQGQLGRGTVSPHEEVGPVLGLRDVVSIDAGFLITCAVTADGRAFCWGSNPAGQIGQPPYGEGAVMASPVPLEVPSITTATSIVAGTSISCVLLADRTVRCMGPESMLGAGATRGESGILEPLVREVDQIDTNYTGSYVLSGGTLWVWGDNAHGQLMLPGEAYPVPVRAGWTP